MSRSLLTRILLGAVGIASLVSCYAMNTQQLVQKSLADMVFIKGGTYMMGPPKGPWQVGNNAPQHRVKLSNFYFSKYNVSYGKYDAYTHAAGKPLIQKQDFLKYQHQWVFFRNAEHPVNNITWYQANDYCTWLAKKTGLPYSLPTEAQWEYVARDGGKPNWVFATNNGKQELGKNFPSFDQTRYQKGNIAHAAGEPLPVGSMPCTPMGICGLGGEVNQWVKDWYSPTYYAHSPVDNPQGPATGTLKILTAGGIDGSPVYANNYGRTGVSPNMKNGGFRCVINSDLSMSQLKATAEKNLNK